MIKKCLIKAYKKLLQHGQEIWIEIISLLLATALVVPLREGYMLIFGLTSICLQKLEGYYYELSLRWQAAQDTGECRQSKHGHF